MTSPTYVALDSAFRALREHDYDGAIDCFETARSFSPRRIDVLKNVAYVYLRTGDNDRARDRFATVVALAPTDYAAALELAFLDYDEPDPASKARAHRLFDRLRGAPDGRIATEASRAFANVDQAIADRIERLRGALAASAGDYALVRDLAGALEQRNRFAEAEVEYGRLLTIDSSRVAVYLDLARVLDAAGRPADAERALRSAAASYDPFVAEPAKDALVRRRAP